LIKDASQKIGIDMTRHLLLFVLELLGEAVGFALEALGFRLVDGGLAHAGTLRVGVSVIHNTTV